MVLPSGAIRDCHAFFRARPAFAQLYAPCCGILSFATVKAETQTSQCCELLLPKYPINFNCVCSYSSRVPCVS